MNILHIGKYFPPYAGGMETYLRGLLRCSADQGVSTHALVHQSKLGLRNSHETVETQQAPFFVTRAAVWARLLFTPISPGFPWLLKQTIKRSQPDIVHIHMPNVSAFWLLLLPCARKVPWVIHWHADVLASQHSIGLKLFYRLYRPFETALLKRAAAIIATSPPYLASSIPLAPWLTKCHVIPLGLDPSDLSSGNDDGDLQRQAPENAAPLQVLAVGRLSYYKGFDFLIRAAALLEHIDVHIVGNGEKAAALSKLTSQLGIDSRVTFYGHLSDVELQDKFRQADCLCLPSIERTEAFGMVLLEAMYYGKATVISDVEGSGMGWVVEESITGLKVPTGDVEALKNALGKLDSDRAKLSRLGLDGKLKFEQDFHIRKSTAAVLDLYKTLVRTN